MSNNREYRMLDVNMEAKNDEEMIIEGYPITFNQPATHNGFTEIIDERALDDADMSDVPLKYNHEDGHLVIARTKNGSLKLEKDNFGLKMVAKLIDTQSNKDIYKSIKAGLIDKMSFAFNVVDDDYDYDTDTRTVRKIGRLFDVSVVDIPFYDSTCVSARKLDNSCDYAEVIATEKENRRQEEEKRKEEYEAKRNALLERLNKLN